MNALMEPIYWVGVGGGAVIGFALCALIVNFVLSH